MRARSLLVSATLVLSILFAARSAEANDPNRVFSGKIITSSKRPPGQAKSPDAYISAIRKLSQANFFEDKTDHTWTIWLAAFLKTPLNDVEYSVKFYELGGHAQQLLGVIDQYTDTRGEKTIITKVKLEKKTFGVNKNVLVTIENKGKVLASAQIKILGEGERFSGKVDFSKDETEGKDPDDDAKK
jgi:hypothetical protein